MVLGEFCFEHLLGVTVALIFIWKLRVHQAVYLEIDSDLPYNNSIALQHNSKKYSVDWPSSGSSCFKLIHTWNKKGVHDWYASNKKPSVFVAVIFMLVRAHRARVHARAAHTKLMCLSAIKPIDYSLHPLSVPRGALNDSYNCTYSTLSFGAAVTTKRTLRLFHDAANYLFVVAEESCHWRPFWLRWDIYIYTYLQRRTLTSFRRSWVAIKGYPFTDGHLLVATTIRSINSTAKLHAHQQHAVWSSPLDMQRSIDIAPCS